MRIDERTRVEQAVQRWATQHGLLYIKLELQHHKGQPDDMFYLPGGRPILMEFKAPGEEPDPLQEFTHQQLRYLGYEIYVIDDPQEGVKILANKLAAKKGSK